MTPELKAKQAAAHEALKDLPHLDTLDLLDAALTIEGYVADLEAIEKEYGIRKCVYNRLRDRIMGGDEF